VVAVISAEAIYSIGAIAWGTVELEPEVRDWFESLAASQFATAAFYVDLVADRGPLLGEPYTRQLDGKLRESRFHPDGRIVLLTVFAKTRMREVAEVERARRALARCLAEEHRVEEGDD